jgi:hypothetical protein
MHLLWVHVNRRSKSRPAWNRRRVLCLSAISARCVWGTPPKLAEMILVAFFGPALGLARYGLRRLWSLRRHYCPAPSPLLNALACAPHLPHLADVGSRL